MKFNKTEISKEKHYNIRENNPMFGKRKFKFTKDEIWWLYKICDMTTKQIGKIFNTSPRLICNYMERFGIKRRTNRIYQRGNLHINWKGGKTIHAGGYIYEHCPEHPASSRSGYFLQHRLIAEKALGRYLKSIETVHHINGDPKDNRNCNLLVCNRSYHHYLEKKMVQLYKEEHFA